MIKLKLSELEEARRDPVKYRSNIGKPRGHAAWGYFNALREAIRQYHKSGDNASAGHSYLEEKLDNFSNHRKSLDTVNQLAWYIEEYKKHGWIARETYRVITVPINNDEIQVRCTGEICRLDLILSGGYGVWQFRSKNPEGWKNELRMPIIQGVTAQLLGVSPAEIMMGTVSFEERYIDTCSFSSEEIDSAFHEFINLLRFLAT